MCVLLYHLQCTFTYIVLFHPHNIPTNQAGQVVLCLFTDKQQKQTCSNLKSNKNNTKKEAGFGILHTISDPTI